MPRAIFTFGVILTAIATLLHIYVFWRACSVPFLRHLAGPRTIAIVGLALWVIFVVIRHSRLSAVSSILELLSMDWLATLFLICICLWSSEIITGFGFLLPKYAPAIRGWAMLVGIILSALAMIQGMRPPVVQSYNVHLANLPPELNGKVLVVMSDMHLGSLIGQDWLDARVAQVQALQPDMVILLGDIFDRHDSPNPGLIAGLNRLSAPLGVWSVQGNHEAWGGIYDPSSPLADGLNAQMLRNRWVEVKPGLILAGVDDLTAARRDGRDPAGMVEQTLAGRPDGVMTILLSHTPWQAELAAQRGVSLMISGHTHGGQIWPFGYIVRRIYPLFAGQYDVDGMAMIVTRGAGTWGPRMRLWRTGEIARITLLAK